MFSMDARITLPPPPRSSSGSQATPQSPLRALRQGACGTVWHLRAGPGGVPGALWSAAAPDCGSPHDAVSAVDGARRRPPWIWFAANGDPFTSEAGAASRDDAARAVAAILGRDVDVAVVTRGGLADNAALVDVARRAGPRLSVRVGVFAADRALTAAWEPGLAPTAERLALAHALDAAGADVAVEIGPLIPFVNAERPALEATMRAIGRAGMRTVVPRWIAERRGVADAVDRGVRRGAGRLLSGWFRQRGADVPGGGRSIPRSARSPREADLHRLGRTFGITVSTCACFELGRPSVCVARPRAVEQLALPVTG